METFILSRREKGVTVLDFRFNEISLEQREQLKEQLRKFIGGVEKNFIINLARVGFLSSLLIATIVFFTKEVKMRAGDVKLCSLSDEALSVFQLTKLDRVFECYDTERDALESFKGK